MICPQRHKATAVERREQLIREQKREAARLIEASIHSLRRGGPRGGCPRCNELHDRPLLPRRRAS